MHLDCGNTLPINPFSGVVLGFHSHPVNGAGEAIVSIQQERIQIPEVRHCHHVANLALQEHQQGQEESNVTPDLQLFQLPLTLAAYRRTGKGVTPSPLIPLQRQTLISPELPSFMPGSRGIFYFLRHSTARVTLHCKSRAHLTIQNVQRHQKWQMEHSRCQEANL